MTCYRCGKPLDTMDIGAHRKFIGKCDSEYLCRDCIAEHFGWTRETLDGWIRRFQENGCLLFPPLKKECPAGGHVKMVDAESGFDG